VNPIASYGAYQKDYYDNSVKEKSTGRAARTGRKEKTDKDSQVKLSERAEKLLQELKGKYGNMDFIIADYETDEEAQEYLSRGTKEYSVLIDPETLEAMASDSETKQKYMGIIDEATGKLDSLKEQLKGEDDTVIRFGINVDKNGTVSYFAELEKMGEKQRERIEQSREERAEERAEERRRNRRAEGRPEDFIAPNRGKRTRVTADSVEEACAFVKARPKPLALYLFTSARRAEEKVLREVSYGGGCVNDTVIHLATSRLGFGGVGDSGMGAYHGKKSFGTFSHEKSIVKKYTWLDLPMRYQPYKEFHNKRIHLFLK